MKLRIGLVIVLVTAALGVAAPSFAAVTCGASVTHNIKLTKNLKCTGGNGLEVDAPNVTVNLNGYTISTTLLNNGIGVYSNSVDGTVVKNGTIKNFNDGIRISGGIGGTISKIHAVNNQHNLRLSGVLNFSVTHNTTKGGDAGILVENGSGYPTITYNNLTPGAGSGIRLNGTDGSYIAHNTIPSGLDRGIYLLNNADSNDVFANIVKNTPTAGIEISNSNSNVIDGNTMSGTGLGLDLEASSPGFSTSNQLSNNVITGSTNDGLSVQANATGTLLDTNTANSNGNNGIEVQSTDANTHLHANTANNNVNFGIFAAAGVTDDGGNTATGNGATNCIGVSC
jgi:parallel beta-helix repeat protein